MSRQLGTRSALDEQAWWVVCKKAAVQAQKNCGLSDGYYVDLFSSEIDAHVESLPNEQRAQALKIAEEWDYATPAQRLENQEWNAAHGYCTHSIALGCCPLGCGS